MNAPPHPAPPHPAARILQAAQHYYGLEQDRPDRLLHRLQREDPKFRPTLLSVYHHTHPGALSASRVHELDEARARLSAYTAARDRLAQAVPGLRPVKGLAISACYPAPLLRHQGDLDLHTPGEAALWRAARELTTDGWELTHIAVRHVDNAPAHLLSFHHPHGDDLAHPLCIELTDVDWLGDGRRSAPRRTLPTAASPEGTAAGDLVTSLLFLSLEALERPLGLRDAVDTWLMANRLTTDDRTLLAELIDRLRLHEGYQRLRTTAERAGLLADCGLLPETPRPRRRTPALRRPDDAVLHWLQWAGFYRRPSRLREAVWERLGMYIDAPKAFRTGLWTFGIPAHELGDHGHPSVYGTTAPLPEETAVLRGRRRLSTPLGDFLLVAGPRAPANILDAT